MIFTMNEEDFNESLYLYNAVIEYVYFLIELIEAGGPKDLNNVEKHLKFFNRDIYDFVRIFNGEDLAAKIGTMLCVTTPIFNVKEKLLNLSFHVKYFKQAIYKDFLISKIVDSVLRGMCCIKDICHNLNLNSMIRIEEKTLSVILKKYPYFYLDSNNSVIICQFHGLLGFEDHAYKTVVQYFHSYLQNINVLTYSEVILHEKCIPTCAISPLFLFCALHICPIFKCKEGKVKLRKKFREHKYGNQIIKIEKLNMSFSESVPIGLLVSKAFGRTLYNWTGEISELTKSTGQIQCVVNFSNEYQGIFVIYMYKTALKHICETEDLNDYLSMRDTVEFDAVYCEESIVQHIFWEATRIKVIKQSLKKNKFKLDVDVENHFEKTRLNSNSLNIITSKTCNLRNCSANFLVLEKNLSAISEKKDNDKFSSGLDTKLAPKLQSAICEKSSNLSQDSVCLINKAVSTTNQSFLFKDSKEESQCVFKKGCEISLSAVKKDSNQNDIISDVLFLHSSFVFGEVIVASEDDGIAVTMNALNQFNVFFKSEALFPENAKRIPAKGSIVLLFIPYFESEHSSFVATLVYLLNSKESALLKNNISIENFVMGNFFPVVQKCLGDIYSCFCGLAHTLTERLLISQEFETKGKKLSETFDFIKSLRETFSFSEKTLTLFYILINQIYSQNLGVTCRKLCVDLVFLFVQAFSFTNCSKKLKVLYKGRKTLNNHCYKRNYTSHFLPYKKTSCSETSYPVSNSIKVEMPVSDLLSFYPKSDIKGEILIRSKDLCLSENACDVKFDSALLQVKSFAEQGHGSCISINSYKSCNSKSSDDVFYSCESDSDSERNENSMPSHTNSAHIFKENDHRNNAINYNEVYDSLPLAEKSRDLSNGEKDIPTITLSILRKKSSEKLAFANSLHTDFKLRHSSLFKAKNRKNKNKIILPSSNNLCKECWNPVIETTAYISTITNSCLYFYAKYKQQTATLGFPRYLVSEEVLKSLSLGSSVKIGIIPNILLHFSDVLYINMCSN